MRGEPRGPFVFYCLADPALLALIDDVRKWTATRNAQAPKHPSTQAPTGGSDADAKVPSQVSGDSPAFCATTGRRGAASFCSVVSKRSRDRAAP